MAEMQDDGKTPETPRWHQHFLRGVMPVAVCKCTDGNHFPRDWKHESDANHLEGALREAEAKAALADEYKAQRDDAVNALEGTIAAAWFGIRPLEDDGAIGIQERVQKADETLQRLRALQQPKAGS